MVANKGRAHEGYEFMLSSAYGAEVKSGELSHDDLLAKTDALYRQIEDTGCLAEDPYAHVEMVGDWTGGL